MKNIFLLIVLFAQFFSYGQNSIVQLDTSSFTCREHLNNEYKQKFEVINKNMTFQNSAQKHIIKDAYSELQSSFLNKINNNNFICDSNVNSYLDGLLKEVLVKNNIDSKNYRILLSRNSEINAYNTGDGTVVVNYGLFVELDNEDELVFVISHEIGHQYLNHVKNGIESYARQSTSQEVIKKTKEIKSEKYGRAGKAFDLLKSLRYGSYKERRKKEIEADSIGLIFYAKTMRSSKAAITVLEKLDISDIERDSLIIDDYKAIFEKNGFTMKQKYFEQEESLFTKYDKEKRFDVDSLKSHPDCSTRIKLIKEYLNNKFEGVSSKSKGFDDIKKNSYYQNLINLYNEERYGISLYEALKIYKNDQNDEMLRNIIYINLVKIYDSRKNYTINRYVPAHDNTDNTDSLNRFVSFVNNIKMTDFEMIINNFKSLE